MVISLEQNGKIMLYKHTYKYGIGIAGVVAALMFMSLYGFYHPQEKIEDAGQNLAKNDNLGRKASSPALSGGKQPIEVSVESEHLTKQSSAQLYEQAIKAKETIATQPEQKDVLIANCLQIVQDYPDSPQAQKAIELLQNIPATDIEAYQKEYGIGYFEQNKVKRSQSFRRQLP